MTERTKGLLYLLVTILSWGILSINLKLASPYLNVESIVWVRFALSFLCLSLVLFIKDRKAFSLLKRPPRKLVFAALFLMANYYCYAFGVDKTTPSNAQVIVQSGPLLLTICGILYLKESVSKVSFWGMVMAFLGLGLFYRDQLLAFWDNSGDYNLGSLAVLIGAICWASYALLQKGLSKDFDPQALNLFIYLLPAILLLPIVSWSSFLKFDLFGTAMVLALGLNTFFAYGSLAEALKRLDAGEVGVLITLNPLITILIMEYFTSRKVTWIVHERTTLYGFAGAALVILGSILTVKGKNRCQ